jgi:hypothetical protein
MDIDMLLDMPAEPNLLYFLNYPSNNVSEQAGAGQNKSDESGFCVRITLIPKPKAGGNAESGC